MAAEPATNLPPAAGTRGSARQAGSPRRARNSRTSWLAASGSAASVATESSVALSSLRYGTSGRCPRGCGLRRRSATAGRPGSGWCRSRPVALSRSFRVAPRRCPRVRQRPRHPHARPRPGRPRQAQVVVPVRPGLLAGWEGAGARIRHPITRRPGPRRAAPHSDRPDRFVRSSTKLGLGIPPRLRNLLTSTQAWS